jgi:2-keto-4-pentenoate hydratase
MSASTAEPMPQAGHDGAVREVAHALMQARRERRPFDASLLRGELRDAGQAYAVQRAVAESLQGTDPGLPRYWKSGGPSREATPTHAPLPAEGVWPSPANAGDWPCNLRLIEIEIALRLRHDVSAQDAADLSHHTALACVDAMTVSIELVDSRWTQGMQAPALLKLADLQSHGALVLGEWIPFSAQDWSAQRACVRIGNGAPVEFRGTHSMGDPAFVLPAWLRHATRNGETAPRGTVVTTGTWCGMLPAAAGDLVSVRFDGIGKASLQL